MVLPPDHVLIAAGWIRVPVRRIRIKSRPRVGQVYWVDFPKDADPPEFVGEHPGIVIRAARGLSDTCVVIPMSTAAQSRPHLVHALKTNPIPRSGGRLTHAICDHFYTVHVNRLRPLVSATGQPLFPKVTADDFSEISRKVRLVLSVMLETSAQALGQATE